MFGRRKKINPRWVARKWAFFHPFKSRQVKAFLRDAKRKGWV